MSDTFEAREALEAGLVFTGRGYAWRGDRPFPEEMIEVKTLMLGEDVEKGEHLIMKENGLLGIYDKDDELTAELHREKGINRKLRNEIRVLWQRLRDANRGAKTNAGINWEYAKEISELKESLELYKTLYGKAVEACMFMHDEAESLGLIPGIANLTTDGVKALKEQRDRLKEELEKAVSASCENFKDSRDSASKLIVAQGTIRRILTHPFLSSFASPQEIQDMEEAVK